MPTRNKTIEVKGKDVKVGKEMRSDLLADY